MSTFRYLWLFSSLAYFSKIAAQQQNMTIILIRINSQVFSFFFLMFYCSIWSIVMYVICIEDGKKGEITKEFTHYRAKIRIFDPFRRRYLVVFRFAFDLPTIWCQRSNSHSIRSSFRCFSHAKVFFLLSHPFARAHIVLMKWKYSFA